jgi:hypothetical protein
MIGSSLFIYKVIVYVSA